MNYLSELYQTFIDLWKDGDPRLSGRPLMSTPVPTIAICAAYVYVVTVAGPRYMTHRKPYELRSLMVVYNFTMVLVSAYMFIKLGIHGWFGKYSVRCQPVDYSDHEDALAMVELAYLYYMSKYVEFLDTIFFVLRKKWSQVTLLHVVHHGIMPMSVWWGVKFSPGGHSSFFAFLNTFVHVLMYTYYGLAACGPQIHKYLWWKKYITTIQMLQFVIIFLHSFQLLFRECNYPRGFMWWIGFHAIMFWILFYQFYKQKYTKRKQQKQQKRQQPVANTERSDSTLLCATDDHYSATKQNNGNANNKTHIH